MYALSIGFLLTFFFEAHLANGKIICSSKNQEPLYESVATASVQSKYYLVCEGGLWHRRSCPQDQVFDSILNICDYEEFILARQRDKSEECEVKNGKYLKPYSGCRKYYKCENGRRRELRCPHGTIFRDDLKLCDWEELVECKETKENKKDKKCPLPNGYFLKPNTKCKEYYVCTNGRPKEMSCPYDELFNEESNECEWKELVDCKDIDKKDTKTTTNTPPKEISTLETTNPTQSYTTMLSTNAPKITVSEKRFTETGTDESSVTIGIRTSRQEFTVTAVTSDQSERTKISLSTDITTENEHTEETQRTKITTPKESTRQTEFTKQRTKPATEQTEFTKERTEPTTEQTEFTQERTGPTAEQTEFTRERTEPTTEQTEFTRERTEHTTEQTEFTKERTEHTREQSQFTQERTEHTKEQTEFTREQTEPTTEQTEFTQERTKLTTPDESTDQTEINTQKESKKPEITSPRTQKTSPGYITFIVTSGNDFTEIVTVTPENMTPVSEEPSKPITESDINSSSATLTNQISTNPYSSRPHRTESDSLETISNKPTRVVEGTMQTNDITSEGTETESTVTFQTKVTEEEEKVSKDLSTSATSNEDRLSQTSTVMIESTTDFVPTTRRGCVFGDPDCRPDKILCPKRSGLFPHPDDPTIFLHCDHWKPYIKECPSNLHFDPKTKRCEHPK